MSAIKLEEILPPETYVSTRTQSSVNLFKRQYITTGQDQVQGSRVVI